MGGPLPGPASLSSGEWKRERGRVLSAGDAWNIVVLKHLIRPVLTPHGAPAPRRQQSCEMPSSGYREAETLTGCIIVMMSYSLETWAAILGAWEVVNQTPGVVIP